MAERYCIHSQRINEFIDQHFDDIRAPFTAGFELTAKCNLNCVHCYAKCDRNHEDFTTEEFKNLFDQLIDRGLLEVYFTGGEIFTRPDFDELYIHAKKKGVILVLLSNITLLNQHHIDLFREYPVENISTTMYGYSEEAYEKVTGVKGSYKKFMDALDLIRLNNLPFELKFVTLNENKEDLYKVREFGKSLGVEMVVSNGIHPESNGEMNPMNSRLTPEEAFEFDWKDPARREFWHDIARQLLAGEIDLIPSRAKERFAKGYLYPCSIAHQHVFITSDFHMQGCVRASFKRYNLRGGSFDEGWSFLQREFLDKKASPSFRCIHCKDIRFCEQCTANFAQVSGNEETPDEFYCQIAKLRHQLVENDIRELLKKQ
ncbi:MAG: radical SAM protein [Clostridia bacterium]|nr:radical SAM protein [Clostridia bacterium]